MLGRSPSELLGVDPREGGDHGCHRTFVVARAATVHAAVRQRAAKGIDRHTVDRDRVLVDVPQLKLAALCDEPAPRYDSQQILAAGMNLLPQPSPAEPLAEGLQEIGQPGLAVNLASRFVSQGIDAGDRD